VSGTLYGTTQFGGTYDCHKITCGAGTVFSITTDGTEKVLHSFGERNDGSVPRAALINVDGKLYGTTSSGGTNGDGTVFSLTPSGDEKVLHNFGEGSDGQVPTAGLVDVDGTLYGTTSGGGAYSCYVSGGYLPCGTVFSITTGGKERVLHSFGKGTDGMTPAASLINVKGTLYGTTYAGGADHGAGTVFSITPDGTEKVLHSFGEGTDGIGPAAGLIDLSGTLYGTTTIGGTYDSEIYKGGTYGRDIYEGGTVFSVTRSGKEKVLHSFGKGKDGDDPQAGLIKLMGRLYGTASSGGLHGYGGVFLLTP
jgi:uncharacterized repeat protein (TIGR03803 family)